MTERTLAIIKPDAVERRLAGKIIQRIEDEGFQIRAMRRVHLSKAQAEGFYAVHRERPFFGSLTAFMSSGPAIVLVLEAPDAIKKWRTLMGATDPAKADAGTLRKEFAQSIERNATHGSDAPDTAAYEIGYFFAGRRSDLRRCMDTRTQRHDWERLLSPRVLVLLGDVGKTLVLVGLGIAALGLLIMLGVPLGRLPGDFYVRRGNFSFYFPLATSIS